MSNSPLLTSHMPACNLIFAAPSHHGLGRALATGGMSAGFRAAAFPQAPKTGYNWGRNLEPWKNLPPYDPQHQRFGP